MTSNQSKGNNQKEQPLYLLAMHSSTDNLGIAALNTKDPESSLRISTFSIGRKMSNCIFECVEKVLPSSKWPHIGRLAVTTGPGGFTGTRLSISMARIIAQQNNCFLDGINSFALMAPRLCKQLTSKTLNNPFWIIKPLKRRGIIAGKYQINKNTSNPRFEDIIEISAPHLINKEEKLLTTLDVNEDVNEDVKILMKLCLRNHINHKESLWENILPIYPTSPLDKAT